MPRTLTAAPEPFRPASGKHLAAPATPSMTSLKPASVSMTHTGIAEFAINAFAHDLADALAKQGKHP